MKDESIDDIMAGWTLICKSCRGVKEESEPCSGCGCLIGVWVDNTSFEHENTRRVQQQALLPISVIPGRRMVHPGGMNPAGE